MRIEGIHSSGSRIEITKNDVRLYEVSCYDTNGVLIFQSSFRDIQNGKIQARKQFHFQGIWRWDVTIELKPQDIAKKIYITRIEAIVFLHKGYLIRCDTPEGIVTFMKKPYGVYEIKMHNVNMVLEDTIEKNFTNLKKIMNQNDRYYYIEIGNQIGI